MSILQRFHRIHLIQNNINIKHCLSFNSVSFYSRKSDSESFESSYKVVKSKVRLDNGNEGLGGEGGPNWELLAPRGNRFFFPDSVGPAWQEDSTTIPTRTPLDVLVDFNGKGNGKFDVSVALCPSLLRKNLYELFPTPEVASTDDLTLIILKCKNKYEYEKGASKFVLTAREICANLRLHGYWADFMNPFSGKPFYSFSSGKSLYKIDQRFRGLGMKLEKQNNCVVISTDDDNSFSGCVYTNAPSNLAALKSLIVEE